MAEVPAGVASAAMVSDGNDIAPRKRTVGLWQKRKSPTLAPPAKKTRAGPARVEKGNRPGLLFLLGGDGLAAFDGHLLEDTSLHFGGEGGIGAEGLLRGLAALADQLAIEGNPRAFFLEHLVVDAEVD